MGLKNLLVLIAVAAAGIGWVHRPAAQEAKRVIGQTAEVGIVEAGMELTARVDTGAATTSVHAESLRVENGMASFELVDHAGRRVSMRLPVARTGTIRNAERSEERIYVEMTLQYNGNAKKVQVNLNDRSGLTYPLLLGRNWLKDDWLVDVSKLPDGPEGAAPKLPSLAASE